MDTYTMIPTRLIRDRALRAGVDVAVYAALDSYAGRRGECYPSISTIAETAGLSRPTVIAALRRLASSGYITRQSKRLAGTKAHGNNHYTLTFRTSLSQQSGGEHNDVTGRKIDEKSHYDKVNATFLDFWQAYPKKDGEDGARREWRRLFPFGRDDAAYRATLDRVSDRLSALLERFNEGDLELRFVPKAQNWLKDEDWSHD
jgi:DNA-binding transcriptional MocR family regulator